VARQVRKIVDNDLYCGGKGYPALIERERWDRIQETRTRLDPAAIQRRKGGRPTGEDYLLRGVALCLRCGSPLYTRRQASGRVYVCKAVRQCEGTCDAPAIPAELAETQVLNHLSAFMGSVKEWINTRLNAVDGEQRKREVGVAQQQAQLAELERKREKLYAEYIRLVEDGDRLARLALEPIERMDREVGRQRHAVIEAEALLSEFSCPPDVDAALDFYNQVADQIQGKIDAARGTREVNQALHGYSPESGSSSSPSGNACSLSSSFATQRRSA